MSTMPPLPPLAELQAPPEWRCIDFISDLHLAAETPLSFDAWVHYMATTTADAVFILGDLVEVWVGDDSRFEGFDARFANALSLAASQRWVGFMPGNRDFLIGPSMLTACGVHALADPTLLHAFGQSVLLTHGDALCLADIPYQRFRAQVRSAEWQQQFLAQPLAARREFARSVRAASEERKRLDPVNSTSENWADVDTAIAAQWVSQAGATALVHGHTHLPGSTPLACGSQRHVLSDWDMDHPPQRADVLRYTRQGWQRLAPCDTVAST